MSDLDEAAARARLLVERAETLARARSLDATIDGIVDAALDSNLDDEHDPEGGTIAAERSMVSALSRGAHDRIAEIDAALARVQSGTYGTCTRCGRTIGAGRLEARPYAALCVACAADPDGR